MRHWIGIVGLVGMVLSVFCAGALAQARPPNLEPLPPPPISGADEPTVRIPVQRADKIEEVRQNGRVVMLKVTPPGGKTYYLLDTTGNGNWVRKDSLDDGVRVPMWPVYTFD